MAGGASPRRWANPRVYSNGGEDDERDRKKAEWGYAALLVAVAVGALVVACDTPVPTEVREAFEEATAEVEAQGADAGQENWIERFLGAAAFGPDPAPLLYVDGVRIRSEEDLVFSKEVFLADVETGQVQKLAESIERVEVLKGKAAAKLYGEEAAGGVIQIFTEGAEGEREHLILTSVRQKRTVDWLVKGQANVDEPVATGGAAGREIVVTGVAGQEPEVRVIAVPSVRQFVVGRQGRATDQVGDWDKWFAENVVTKAPPGWEPVVYVDGVRVDGGWSGLNDLLPSLHPDRIERIEVGKGEVARKRYGREGANGVIHIYTKKKSP